MITIKYILRGLLVPPLIYRCLHHSAHFSRLQLNISRNSSKLFDLPLSEPDRSTGCISFFLRLKCAFAELLGIRGWPPFPVLPGVDSGPSIAWWWWGKWCWCWCWWVTCSSTRVQTISWIFKAEMLYLARLTFKISKTGNVFIIPFITDGRFGICLTF